MVYADLLLRKTTNSSTALKLSAIVQQTNLTQVTLFSRSTNVEVLKLSTASHSLHQQMLSSVESFNASTFVDLETRVSNKILRDSKVKNEYSQY